MDATYDSPVQRWFKVIWKPILALPSPIVILLLPILAIWIYRFWFLQGLEDVARFVATHCLNRLGCHTMSREGQNSVNLTTIVTCICTPIVLHLAATGGYDEQNSHDPGTS